VNKKEGLRTHSDPWNTWSGLR